MANLRMSPSRGQAGLQRISVFKDRLFFQPCDPIVTPDPLSERACNPELDEWMLQKPFATARFVAGSIGSKWAQTDDHRKLYVPTFAGLVEYDFAKSDPTTIYESPLVRFVNVSSGSIWLGMARKDEVSSGLPSTQPASSSTMVNLFDHLCQLNNDWTKTVHLSGPGFLNWYFEIGGIGILVGTDLNVAAMLGPKKNRAPNHTRLKSPQAPPMKICLKAICKKEDWQEAPTLPLATMFIAPLKVTYHVREEITQASTEGLLDIWVVSPYAFLAACFLVTLIGLLVAARWLQLARVLLFAVLPATGWKAYLNLLVLGISFIDAYRRWALHPVLAVAAQNGNPSEIDRDVASRALLGDPTEGSFIVYNCVPNEVDDRVRSLCSIIANTTLTEGPVKKWRLPIAVRLSDQPNGDLKEALARRLQRYALDNDVFLKHVIRSRRLVFVLFDLQGVETAAAAAVAQTVRNQKSHSICITTGGSPPGGLGPVRYTTNSQSRRLHMFPHKELTGNS